MKTGWSATTMRLGSVVALWLVLLAMPLSALGAVCSEVYSDPNGVNSTLPPDEQLDLSGVPFEDGNWRPSGTGLDDGEYFYRGRTLGNNYELAVDSGDQARIFVNGSLSLGQNTELNAGGDADQLLLVVNGSLSIGNNSEINALIYATGGITIGNNSEISGGIASEGNISTSPNVDVSLDSNAVSSGLLSGLCTSGADSGPVVLSVNGESSGPVTVEPGETFNLSVSATNCIAGFRYWGDNWTNAGPPAQEAGFTSPCDRSPIERTHSFENEGTYTITYESFSCTFLGCETQGSDSITVEVVDIPLSCFNDEFSSRSELGENWVTAVSSGDFTPGIVNGRLRMTEDEGNQATAATIQREIPGADNLVRLTFDYYAYGGSGADGLAVVLSDASVSPSPGGYGGSLGYANSTGGSGSDGFAGGWLGIGLDEYGNYSNPTEGRNGGVGFTENAVALRGSGSGRQGYEYLEGTDELSPGVDATGSTSPHRYRITIDSRDTDEAMVTIERDTGNGYNTLIGPIDVLNQGAGQAAVPENFLLSLTGSTGGSNNIHELGNVELCARELNQVGEQVDHFEMTFDAVALTCTPLDVDIRACANSDCSELFTDPVDVTMAPSGWVGGDTFTISDGSTTRPLRRTEADDVTIGVAGSSPTKRPLTDNLCRAGGGPLASDQCEVTFRESALAMSIPDQTANRPSGPISIRAVERDDETNACVPAFSGVRRDVAFWSQYVDPGPDGRPESRPVYVNGDDIGQSESEAEVFELQFDETGTATINVRYSDAGRMNLNALYQGTTGNNDEGLVMPGDAGWVSVPQGLCVETGFECEAADSSCSAGQVAGEGFEMDVTAVGWENGGNDNLCSGNPSTPNFALDGIGLSHDLVAPADGREGQLALTGYDHARSGNAQQTVNGQALSEVGVFTVSATPQDNAYFGATVPSGTSAPSGRVFPDWFDVSVSDPGEIAPYCSQGAPFAYSGQALSWAQEPVVEVTALNANGNTTRNYTRSGFLKLAPADVLREEPSADNGATDADGTPYSVSITLDDGSFLAASEGRIEYGFAGSDELSYEKTVTSRVEPFNPQLQMRVTEVTDSDGVAGQALPLDWIPAAPFKLRYGRLAIENAYGPETLPLTLPMRAEYWASDGFRLNTDGGCWAYDTTDAANGVTLNPGDLTSVVPASGMLVGGKPEVDQELELAAPGEGNTGDVRATFGVPSWLQDDFNNDGALEPPSGLATFGVYRGHDRIIYWREVQ